MKAFSGIQPRLIEKAKKMDWIIGHRGFPRVAPENTLISFERAVQAGADMLEFDVTLSREGIPVVIHDATLERTTNGYGHVRKKGLATLRTLDAGGWFGPRFSGEFIPTLDEVLRHFGSRVAMNIEIKREAFSIQRPWVVEQVLSAIKRLGLAKTTVVSSFSADVVRMAKDLSPNQSVAILTARPVKHLEDLIARTSADALHVAVPVISDRLVEQMKEMNLPLRVFTVNQKREATRLFDLGVQAIFTDDVRVLAR